MHNDKLSSPYTFNKLHLSFSCSYCENDLHVIDIPKTHNNNNNYVVGTSHEMMVTYSLRSNGLLCFIVQSAADAVEFTAGMFSARRDDLSFLRPARWR